MAEKKKAEETKTPEKDKRDIFIKNRLAAINEIKDKGKARRATTALFRKGN